MPPELQNASVPTLLAASLIATLVLSLVIGLVLKFVAESVLKYRVGFLASFKAAFVATLIQVVGLMILLLTGSVSAEAASGIALQVVGLIFGVVVLAFAISIFVRAPDGSRPEFAQSGVAAAIVQVVMLVILIAMTAAGLPMTGHF